MLDDIYGLIRAADPIILDVRPNSGG